VATYSHLEGNNTQDAAFRAGVCLYAMEQYDRARVHFESWLQKYPSGARRAGVYAFLGDIEAYHGKGEEALRYYRRVERTPGVTDDDIAYANQRMAAVYEMFFKDWKSIKELYQTYLANYGTKGNYTEAIYRIGQAQSQLGETDAMLEGYREAIANYGDDPNAFQMDDVLDLYLAEFIRLNHRFPADEFQKLRSLADPSDRPTLHLRLARAADQVDPTIPGAPAKLPMAEVLTAKNLRHASPAIALWMGEQAIASDRAFARKCFQKIENEADAGRIAAEATYQLATMDLADGHTAEAITRLEKFRGEFISSPRAPRALLDLATQFKGQERWEDALAACRQVLENKQWKGAAWPEALYLSGEVEFERSRYADAHAFFQRVYLLYAGYPEWMAKAYLRAAICAERLGRFEDAETTLREMASIEGLESFSAYREGNELLKQLTK
jgi:TolA-binding protein